MTTIQLKNAASDSLDGMTLQIAYFAKAAGGAVAPVAEDFDASGGSVTWTLPSALATDRDVFLSVLHRSTNVLTQRTVLASELAEVESVLLEFDYDPLVLEAPPVETPAPRPAFVYGRLLDKAGVADMEGVQIVFYATRQSEGAPEPFASVRTESNGYFFLEYPSGPFVAAAALVGRSLVENPLPIRLEQTIEDDVVSLSFPRRVVLVAELTQVEAQAKEECGCGELDMHSQKRVLEEYSFHTLVRTTEPQVRGYVLEEDADISLEDLLKLHPLRATEMLEELVKLPVFTNAVMRSRLPATSVAPAPAELAEAVKSVTIPRSAVHRFIGRESAITPGNIVELLDMSEADRVRTAVAPPPIQPLGRVVLGTDHFVDWDKEPTLYQAVSIAHGHLLHFKTEWIADGYSLGDLLYSLPLAPGQKKQIVVFDWERRESASNAQAVDYEESLYNSLGRDRDIFEITKGAIREQVAGRSSSTTASASAGIGGVIKGVLFGVSGGVGHSRSNASQDSLRQTSASDSQKIRDRLVQSANAVRTQRSSVIQTVAQGERFEVSSETVANYNHCHAITIQYFEVLRHFKVRQRFVEARECIFVPLAIARFDLDKALRWREPLDPAIDRRLKGAFDAADRVKNRWSDSNFPSGTFASEKILTASGSFQIKFVLRRPPDKLVEVDDTSKPIFAGGGFGTPPTIVGYQKKTVEDINEANWQTFIPFLGATTPRDFYDQYLRNAANKEEVFHRELGEKIARAFVDALTFHVADETGNEISSMELDATLSSRYRKEGTLNISVHYMGPSPFAREKLHYLKIRCGATNTLPDFSTVTVESGFIRYKSPHYQGFLCNFRSIQDDLGASDGVTLYAGPTADELRDPRKEDVATLNRLLDHLNDNLETFHKTVWLALSPDRRFLLLDGIMLPPESKAPGRSLASLVENELIGVVGNSLVFPVAPGLNLDPSFGLSESLTDFYRVAETEPMSVSVPTKGVYAEAMMGRCNSCEEKDETRFWRWEESPIPDSPTQILPIDTSSRRADPGNLQPAPLATPIVSIQNATAAPDPTGLAGTLALLGKGDSFRDVTGLAQNQSNAIEALKASFETTKAFGQEAAKLETQRIMTDRLDSAIKAINSNPNLDKEQKAALTEKALNAYLGAGATAPDADAKARDQKTQEDISKNIERVNKAKSGEMSVKKADGTQVTTKFEDTVASGTPLENRVGKGGVAPLKQTNAKACWATVATMMMRWKDGTNYTIETVLAKAGEKYVQYYRDQRGLPYADKNDFITKLGMTGEPPASYAAAAYRDLLLAFGPLWVTVDADESAGFSAHALVITGVSSDLETFEVIDPSQGSKKRLGFAELSAAFSAVVTDGPSTPVTQIVHFSTPATEGDGDDEEGASDPDKDVNDYVPADATALVINMSEFTTGLTDIHNWTSAAVPHNNSNNGYRLATRVIQIVLHETAADTGDGFDDSNNETSHMSVLRDGKIYQFNDLLEKENHAGGLNGRSIGIEFVNRGWLSSKTTNGGEGIPAHEDDLSEDQKETYKEANGYLWTFWGYGFGIYRVPPSIDQLEREIELLTWLTDTLQTTISQAPVEFQDQYPWFEKIWLQLVSYDDVSSVWKFKEADVPDEDQRAVKKFFAFTTGYDYLTPAKVRNTAGIISHNASYEGHSDGSFLALYTWLRMAKGKDKNTAYALCKTLMKDHWIRVRPKSDDDKQIIVLDVSDANL